MRKSRASRGIAARIDRHTGLLFAMLPSGRRDKAEPSSRDPALRMNGERLPFRPRQACSGVFASAKVYLFSLHKQCMFLTSIEIDLIIAGVIIAAPRVLGKS